MRLAIYGAGGMIGKATAAMGVAGGHAVFTYTSQQCDITSSLEVERTLEDKWDIAINCAGIISLHEAGACKMVATNALGPHILATLLASKDRHLIHVSTDCVFSGRGDPLVPAWRYKIGDVSDPIDLYGKSKSCGEPAAPIVAVVRTSFIGMDHGLLPWALSQNQAEGWEKVWWTGSTVDAVAKSLLDLALDFKPGIHHLATAEKISKCSLLVLIRDIFDLEMSIKPVIAPWIDRALEPTLELEPIELALLRLKEDLG